MKKTKVLIFPAGENNSIELHDALSVCINIELYGASSIDRHGEYVFKKYISGLPLISESHFIEVLNKVILDNKIEFIFPTHDTIALFLRENVDKLVAKVICADLNTSLLCRDKNKTYDFLKDTSFVPLVYKKQSEYSYPMFLKPIDGQGAVGAKKIEKLFDLEGINLEKNVLCEYLPGEEYTVDCFTDKDKKLLFISPRSRQRIFAGISVHGRIEPLTEEIQAIASCLNERMNFRGLWWFQIKKDIHQKWKLLEISTRCSGNMGLTRSRGVNLPLLSVYDAMGYDVQIVENSYHSEVDRVLISRYKTDIIYEYVYIDFDDTIILDDVVNLKAIWFLYQLKNHNKEIILITRHAYDIYKTLKKYCISTDLFTEIIHLSKEQKKSDFVQKENAIFIDNAFQERIDVFENCKIPVFDVDGIDFLMSWI